MFKATDEIIMPFRKIRYDFDEVEILEKEFFNLRH